MMTCNTKTKVIHYNSYKKKKTTIKNFYYYGYFNTIHNDQNYIELIYIQVSSTWKMYRALINNMINIFKFLTFKLKKGKFFEGS